MELIFKHSKIDTVFHLAAKSRIPYSVENPVEVHDLHATMLHLMGVDHRRLTFRQQGRDYRLTDVHGKLVDGIMA